MRPGFGCLIGDSNMKLLDVCQLKAVGGGKMDQDGNPIYDDWYPDGSDGMIPGFELVSPEEGTGPRPDSDPNRTTGQDIGLAITVAVVIASTAVVAVTCPPAAGAAMWAIAKTGAAASHVAWNIG